MDQSQKKEATPKGTRRGPVASRPHPLNAKVRGCTSKGRQRL